MITQDTNACRGEFSVVRSSPHSRSARRASIVLWVLLFLLLIFTIGATLLIVSRFDHRAAEQHQQAEELEAVQEAVIDSVLEQLRLDVVGNDGIPYNSGWSSP
jgi:hypothetical protein